MIKALKSLLNIGLVLFFMVIFSAEARAEAGAPIITKITTQNFFSITGTAPASSEVLIYLDGSFIGQAEINSSAECAAPEPSEASCRSNWYFQYNQAQKMADGTHLVMAIARDKISLVLSAPTDEIRFTINTLPAPTLISPNLKTVTADLKPLVTGLTKDNSSVKIFIDDIFDGQTGILRNDSGTANFFYRPSFNLNRGFHRIRAVAQDGDGQLSADSEELSFNIELPLPAPTMFKPVVNRDTSLNRPFIVGLSKNDCKIKIYIDEKYDGELTVKNHQSGTANFAYKPKEDLVRGGHSVYTVAIDKRGKESIRSNKVNFSTKNSAIAESVTEESKEAVADIKEPAEPAKSESESVVISPSSGTVLEKTEETPAKPTEEPVSTEASLEEKQQAIKQELKDKESTALEKVRSLIGEGAEEAKSDKGMINEGKQNQGRLKLSIILFILFLVGVVAWLLWVNRELVKERRAQNEAEAPSSAKASEDKNKDDKLL